jgi:hypothetical protein
MTAACRIAKTGTNKINCCFSTTAVIDLPAAQCPMQCIFTYLRKEWLGSLYPRARSGHAAWPDQPSSAGQGSTSKYDEHCCIMQCIRVCRRGHVYLSGAACVQAGLYGNRASTAVKITVIQRSCCPSQLQAFVLTKKLRGTCTHLALPFAADIIADLMCGQCYTQDHAQDGHCSRWTPYRQQSMPPSSPCKC